MENLKQTFRNKMLSNPVLKQLVDMKNVVQLLEHSKKEYGNEVAVVLNDGTKKTYNDLYNDVQKIAQSLKDCQGHIGLLAPNSYLFEITALAVMSLGKTVVCLPASLKKEQVFGLCHNLDITTLCYASALEENTSLVKVPKKEISSLLNVEVKGNNFKQDIKERDPAVILLTGGTTGIPKGVILSHTAIMRGMMNGCYGLDKIFKQRYYCMIPLTHSFGFIRNMLTALYTGSSIYYNIDKMAIFKELATYKPTVLILVPATAELFLSLMKAHTVNMFGGQIHTIICGSANVPPYLSLEYAKLNIGFYPGYGMTEFANIVTGNIAPTQFPQSVGLIFPEQEAKIVDGELWLKGRNMMNGYYKNDKANQEAIVDGWFRTGDLAKFDEYDNLYIVGRIKDLIVLDNGEKVSPAYLEAKVLKIDLVKDALVYGQRNDKNVLNLVLEVTLREEVAKTIPNHQEFLNKEIEKINEDSLPYEKISKIIIRDKDFERSPAMKILRKKS